MAGPGGGPPWRSHINSRKGCEACKRRHIRCDEKSPQCHNCTKRKVRCPFMDISFQDRQATLPKKADLLWTPGIEAEIEQWQNTEDFPFPDLYPYPVHLPCCFSAENLRLIYHVASISSGLRTHNRCNFTIWTRDIPTCQKIGFEYSFVMHALLALSAMHLAWVTGCPLTINSANEHRGVALKGLYEAIEKFSQRNSDAVLAASLLLSWEATEWRSWTCLQQGTLAVIDLIRPWKEESHFREFIVGQSPTFMTSTLVNVKNKKRRRRGLPESVELQRIYTQLGKVRAYLKGVNEDLDTVQQLMKIVRSIRHASPSLSTDQRRRKLNSLLRWLFWAPTMFLEQSVCSTPALIVLAHYCSLLLVIQPFFPEVEVTYIRSLSIGPIEEIAHMLLRNSASHTPGYHVDTLLMLLQYPLELVSDFRDREGGRGISAIPVSASTAISTVGLISDQPI